MQFETLLETFDELRHNPLSAWNGCVKNQRYDFAIIGISGERYFAPIRYVAHVAKKGELGKGSISKGEEFESIIECLKSQGFTKVMHSANLDTPQFDEYLIYYSSLPKNDSSTISSRYGRNMTFWITPTINETLPSQDNFASAPTSQSILSAMQEFDRSGMPNSFGPSTFYNLIHPKKQTIYPPKAIWGLASGESSGDFDAVQAKAKLEKLGFYVHDIRIENTAKAWEATVAKATQSSSKERLARIAKSPDKPQASPTLVIRYQRNADVIAERLHMAQGRCELCHKPAPFLRKKNDAPFLEVHHVILLSENGDDTVENTRALCPNCHRDVHFGSAKV